MRGLRRIALIGGLGLALVAAFGCATAPVPVSGPASRPVSPAFWLAGRLALSDGERAASLQVRWRHAASGDWLELTGPLGQTVARLEGEPGGARLFRSDGTMHEAASLAELAEQAFGMAVPVAWLAQWVQAAGFSGEVRERDEAGRPALVIDQGWRIAYPVYRDATPGAPPRRIELSRGDVVVKLVIDAWQVP